MHRFTYVELADMHNSYGAAYGNGNKVRRNYAEWHADRHIP